MLKYLHKFLLFQWISLVLFLLSNIALANAVGTDFHNFNPTSNGIDFVTVQSSEPIAPGVLNLGAFLNYAVNPLYEFVESEPIKRGSIRNSLTSMDINIGLGITNNWDIGLNLPATLDQRVEEKNTRIQFTEKGLNEVRLNSKFRFIGDSQGGLALVLGANINTIENNPYLGKEGGPIYNLELAGDWSISKLAFGINLGYRVRNAGEKFEEVPVEPLKNQYLYSMAISRLISSLDTQIIFEVYGAQAADEPDSAATKRHMTSSEALLGIKHLFSHNLAIHGGASTYLEKNATSPDYRIYTGINWTVGPFWKGKRRKRKKDKKKVVRIITPNVTYLEPIVDEPLPTSEPSLFVLENVEFELNSATRIGKRSLAEINKIGEHLIASGYKRIVIEGHTDSLGSNEYNLKLSKERAINVGAHLIKNFNIDRRLIQVIGKGESEPIADNSTFQGRQRNRRVEIKVYR